MGDASPMQVGAAGREMQPLAKLRVGREGVEEISAWSFPPPTPVFCQGSHCQNPTRSHKVGKLTRKVHRPSPLGH